MSVCVIKMRSLPRRHGSRLHRILFRPLAIAAGEVPKSRAALKLKLITARWKRANTLCAIINIKAWKEQLMFSIIFQMKRYYSRFDKCLMKIIH